MMSPDQAVASRWLRTLTLREKVAQLFVIGFSGHPMHTQSREYRKFVHLVAEEHVGGLILVNVTNGRLVEKANPLEAASFINRMQRLAKVPLLVSADFERGASMRIDATTVFPHAMAFAGFGRSERGPAGRRDHGEGSAGAGSAVAVFPRRRRQQQSGQPDHQYPLIRGESGGRFGFRFGVHRGRTFGARVARPDHGETLPGHGDTDTDTHLDLATIKGDLPRLEAIEWSPFRAAIRSGVDSIMTAHIAVPALDDLGVPATLSRKILNGVLRDEMGFKGLIVTDALEMGGIVKGYPGGEASVRALEAGADVLLMPVDAEAAINAVVEAVRSGKIPLKRVEESDMRILTAKAHVGLGAKRLVDVEEIHSVVDSPESNAIAQEIADRSVTLVRNDGGMIPLRQTDRRSFSCWRKARRRWAGWSLPRKCGGAHRRHW